MDNLGDLFAELQEEKRKKAEKLEKLSQEAKIFEKYLFSAVPKTPKEVKILEKELLALENTSYESIDTLMKGISADLGITPTQLHNNFKDRHGIIPDEWVKQRKKEKQQNEELDNTIDTNNWRNEYAPTEIETENIIEADPIKNEPLPDFVKKSMEVLESTLPEKEELNESESDISQIRRELDRLRTILFDTVGKVEVQGGGGEVNLQYLDDIVGVATNLSAYDGKYLQVDTSNSEQPFQFTTVTQGAVGVATTATRDALQGYYGYTTDFYTVGVANTVQTIGAGVTTLVQPQVGAIYQYMPTPMVEVNTNPYVGTGATIGTGQTQFSLAGLGAGAACIVRTALAFDPDDDNSNLDVQLKFTTNTATQGTGLTNFTIKKEQALIMNEGADQQYISENLFSFFVGPTLEGTTQSDAGSFNIEVIPTSEGELEVLAATVNIVT